MVISASIHISRATFQGVINEENKMNSCIISKNAVLAGDLHEIDPFIDSIINNLKKSEEYSPFDMTISGYTNDPRPLWEVEEIRKWCESLHQKHPYLPFLLSKSTIEWYALCILKIEEVERRKTIFGTSGVYRIMKNEFDNFSAQVIGGSGILFHNICDISTNKQLALMMLSSERMMKALSNVSFITEK